ncbi:MAG: biofilm PGA synthesis N-glycosyltransferase [Fluviicola sp.]|nr:MAG: biofilm PGA synthesis N-glycosyltransferase [Fluviicola sp.]
MDFIAQEVDYFFHYISEVGTSKLVRIFWFFVIFEFSRLFVIDFLALIFIFIKRKLTKKKRKEARRQLFLYNPLISIIVPGKNEGKHIFKLVSSLKEQTYKNYELIIVDDGSDDDTEQICKSLKKNNLIDVFIRNEVRGGKASGANTALRVAKGDFVIHLDADSSLDRDAIEQIITPFYENPDVGAVGGNVMVRNYKETLATTLQSYEYNDAISIGRMVASYLGVYRIISGAFGAFRRDALEQVQGWDIGPGLDGDITVKMRKVGYKVVFEDRAVCQTNVPSSFKNLTKQRLRWDKSLIRFRLRKHKDVFIPDENFSILNFLSFLENIFFTIILNIKWYIYIIDVVINFPGILGMILVMNFFLYSCSNAFKLLLFNFFRERKNSPIYIYFPFIPLMVLYHGYYLRIVRTVAYIKELFFKSSYKDEWNPEKTSIRAKQIGI